MKQPKWQPAGIVHIGERVRSATRTHTNARVTLDCALEKVSRPIVSLAHSVRHAAHAALQDQLARVNEINRKRSENPILAGALERLARWQARRLRQTYADLAVQPRYVDAIRFFEKDLYGNADFARRDADLARVVPLMVRMLPEKVIETVAHAVELNALSHELDAALLAFLPRAASFSVAEYCDAYRAMDRTADRERQIRLIAEVGAALDGHVQKPLVRAALGMMRKPAHIAGFGVLHDFLERGFTAFRGMHGAQEFLSTVVGREMSLMQRIMSGESAPFPDPLSGARAPAA